MKRELERHVDSVDVGKGSGHWTAGSTASCLQLAAQKVVAAAIHHPAMEVFAGASKQELTFEVSLAAEKTASSCSAD